LLAISHWFLAKSQQPTANSQRQKVSSNMVNSRFRIDQAAFEAIWEAHHLGKVSTVEIGGKGRNNPAFVVNNQWVIRFDGIINDGVSRFWGEKRAYDALRAAGIPAPEVIAVDDTHTLAPYDYVIMTKIEGAPLIDCWSSLSAPQREQTAYQAGCLLARMHGITFDTFGKLYGSGRIFDTWYGYVQDYVVRFGGEAVDKGQISSVLYDRIQAVLTQYQPTFDRLARGSLVHWDYHFGNLLQQDDAISGILDFEWALSGDPAHDFNRRDQWEDDCPGSRAPLYAGYTSVRPLEDDHDLRVSLYQLIWFIDCVVDADTPTEADFMRGKLSEMLERLEE
jgi:aminoglycoside phosphotransferase (APT) family kinase protein